MIKFDLFKLHSKTDTPRGWIWVNFNSQLLKKEYIKLLEFKPQNKIAKDIGKNLDCDFSTIVRHLTKLKNSKERLELPLPLVIELTNLINKSKIKIIKSMNYFICKTSTTKQRVKAIKELDENLAKLVGAHIADGHSKPEGQSYRLRISDGRKDSVKIVSKWIKEIFGFNSIIRFNKKDNTYNCWFNNKIIARYFKNIFEIPSGKKAYIVKEPELIKNSSFNIRKAFVKGVMMFDGGVKTSGMVALSSKSEQLINDIYDILLLDGIEINKKYNKKSKIWIIESKSGRNKIYLKKWLGYFEVGTWKYNRLKFFWDEREYNIKELTYLFPKHCLSKVYLENIYNVMNKIKSGKINNILSELNLDVGKTTIYKYIHLLEKANLIYKTDEKNSNGKDYWNETIYNLKCQQ